MTLVRSGPLPILWAAFGTIAALFLVACADDADQGEPLTDQDQGEVAQEDDDCPLNVPVFRCRFAKLDENFRAYEGLLDNLQVMSAATVTDQIANAIMAGSKTPTSISAGWGHSMAVVDDGTVWAWGDNSNGFLGDGTSRARPRPTLVRNLADIVQVSASETHSMATSQQGTVYAWGAGDDGQLGDGNQQFSAMPIIPQALPAQATDIDAGWYRSFSVHTGIGRAWGNNQSSALGDGGSAHQPTPVPVSNLTNIRAISGGKWHTLALRTNGEVWAWGSNPNGLLGIENPAVVSNIVDTATRVPSLVDVAAISAGWEHNLALKEDGTVWAWGKNDLGQLGIAPINTDRPVPTQVPGLSNIQAIAAGGDFSLALQSNGDVFAWGGNFFGQLADGSTRTRVAPALVQGLNNITAIAAGVNHALALEGNSCNIAWAWGLNGAGQLGDGGTHETRARLDFSSKPVPVALGNGAFNSWFPPNGPASNQCRLLRITKIGDGQANITGNPGGLQCGHACRETTIRVTGGPQITITAVVDPVTQFVKWGGACASFGNSVTGTLLIDRSKKCTFESNLVTVPE